MRPARQDARGIRRDWRRPPTGSADGRRTRSARGTCERERHGGSGFPAPARAPSGRRIARRAACRRGVNAAASCFFAVAARTRRNAAAPRDRGVRFHPRRRVVASGEERSGERRSAPRPRPSARRCARARRRYPRRSGSRRRSGRACAGSTAARSGFALARRLRGGNGIGERKRRRGAGRRARAGARRPVPPPRFAAPRGDRSRRPARARH